MPTVVVVRIATELTPNSPKASSWNEGIHSPSIMLSAQRSALAFSAPLFGCAEYGSLLLLPYVLISTFAFQFPLLDRISDLLLCIIVYRYGHRPLSSPFPDNQKVLGDDQLQ